MRNVPNTCNGRLQVGFTLVEVAVVLIITGLLVGGILRGQEMITTARVRNILAQQSAIKTSYFGFIDRFKAMPGDLSSAQAALINASAAASFGTPNDGVVLPVDSPQFFNNLAQAGYIICTACMKAQAVAPTTINSNNSMLNFFGQPMWFTYDRDYYGSNTNGALFLSSNNEASRPLLMTGGTIPSHMLAEMDRKVDNGDPSSGQFRYGDMYDGFTPGTTQLASCITFRANGATWNSSPPVDCQGVSLF